MSYFGEFQPARLSDIKPGGFWAELLNMEKNGLPGHLSEIGYPFDKPCWATKEKTESWSVNWWPYEQSAYWIDSVVRTAALLDDEDFYKMIGPQLEAALRDAEADPDKFIGPETTRENDANHHHRWPHAVLFRALYARWSKTGDTRFLERMRDHYLNDKKFDYAHSRSLINIESMLLCGEALDDVRLINMALQIFDQYLEGEGSVIYPHVFNNMNNIKPEEYESIGRHNRAEMCSYYHGVTFNESAKIPALIYLYTGERKYLDLSRQYFRYMDNSHMMIDGVNSSCEGLGGNEAYALHESCDITDYTWSMGYLLEATGDAAYAEKIERCMLNAYLGALGPGYRSMQYLSAVNQVVARRDSSCALDFQDRKQAYQPLHDPQCCVGNLGRALPNFIGRFAHNTSDGAAISFYGDASFRGENISFSQEGGYPFTDVQTIRVSAADADKNLLRLRLPAWSVSTSVVINNEAAAYTSANGYALIRVKAGDVIELHTTKHFESHNGCGGVYYTYGPFLMSLKIEENRTIDPEEKLQTSDYPAFNLEPASPWNYCVIGEEAPLSIRFGETSVAATKDIGAAPFEITIRARELVGWEIKPRKMSQKWFKKLHYRRPIDTIIATPPLPQAPVSYARLGDECVITLVPYGYTNLRLTVFPRYQEHPAYII